MTTSTGAKPFRELVFLFGTMLEEQAENWALMFSSSL